jgi:hypothetical protein
MSDRIKRVNIIYIRKSQNLPDSSGVRDMVHKILPIQKQEEEDAAQHTSTHACLTNNNYLLFYNIFLLHFKVKLCFLKLLGYA